VIRPADPRDRAAAESVVQEAYSIYLDRMEKPPGPTLDDYGALIAQGLVSVAEDEDSEIAAVVVLMPKADYHDEAPRLKSHGSFHNIYYATLRH
jgi:hypothetical protein